MKIKGFIAIMLLGVLLLGAVACPGPAIAKPTVGYIPQDWYLSEDSPYGTYEELDGTKSGLIEYADAEDFDFVQIYYGDVPPSLQGRENDQNALIAKAIEWSIFDAEETGTMTVAGQVAGYAKAYDPLMDTYEMEIVFVKDSSSIDIYTMYNATYEDEQQAMSIIMSVSL